MNLYSDLTTQELRAINALVDAWNEFMLLPQEHGDDVNEFRAGIHRLQEKVMARPIRRRLK